MALRQSILGRMSARASLVVGNGLVVPSAAVAGFDPASLSLTGWWRASFAGSPWVGTASAGGSGSRDLTESTNQPATGSAVNGLTPADFDGTNDRLANGTAISTLLTASAWSAWALVYVDTIGSPPNFTLGSIVCDTGGYWCIGTWTNSGTKAFVGQWDGGPKGAEAALSVGEWQLLQAKFDGSTLSIRVNGGTPGTSPCGNIQVANGTLVLGRNYTSAQFFDGKVLEVGLLGGSALSTPDEDQILSYCRDRYGLSLT